MSVAAALAAATVSPWANGAEDIEIRASAQSAMDGIRMSIIGIVHEREETCKSFSTFFSDDILPENNAFYHLCGRKMQRFM